MRKCIVNKNSLIMFFNKDEPFSSNKKIVQGSTTIQVVSTQSIKTDHYL